MTMQAEALDIVDDSVALVPAIWTFELFRQTFARRLADDLAKLGRRPSWWRFRARRRYDRSMRRLKRGHMSELQMILAAQDPKHRALIAARLGWRIPTEDSAKDAR